jgi:hypothetical protein
LYFRDKVFVNDLLHILKCVRYNFIESPSWCLFPDSLRARLPKSDFTEIGISETALPDSKSTRQEDGFPLRFFHMKNLGLALQLGKASLHDALLP